MDTHCPFKIKLWMNVNGSKYYLSNSQRMSGQSGNCDYKLSPLDVSLTHTIVFDLSFQSLIQVEDKHRITGETNENKLLL